jgi:hypothetical protein
MCTGLTTSNLRGELTGELRKVNGDEENIKRIGKDTIYVPSNGSKLRRFCYFLYYDGIVSGVL